MTSIYLDVCCLNRPFNDQTQDRIRLEATAVLTVLERVGYGQLLLIGSTVIQAEIDRNRDQELKARLQKLAETATEFIPVGEEQVQRANDLQGLGFHFFDALHIACAEAAGADILLTTDGRLLRLALRVRAKLTVRVANPADWLMEIIDDERNDG
jgi:predicted nucleic acid-binding protein